MSQYYDNLFGILKMWEISLFFLLQCELVSILKLTQIVLVTKPQTFVASVQEGSDLSMFRTCTNKYCFVYFHLMKTLVSLLHRDNFK